MCRKECTKEFIISYIKTYYIDKNKPPLSCDKHPFSRKTVTNKFGSWSEALTAASVPLNANPPRNVLCQQCNKEFKKLESQIKKSKYNLMMNFYIHYLKE